jgi:hypothetical protein
MRLDNGGEYFSHESEHHYCYDNGIRLQPIPAHHPMCNHTAERMNKTILFMERPMRKYSGMPPNTVPEPTFSSVRFKTLTKQTKVQFVTRT